MNIMVDTNILVRANQFQHPDFSLSRQAIVSLQNKAHSLVVAPQVIAEFWNVCTRPLAVNGLGLSIAETNNLTAQMESLFPIARETASIYAVWRRIVVDYAISGSKVHDARLAALMHCQGIPSILTFNIRDFDRFPFVFPIHPSRLI